MSWAPVLPPVGRVHPLRVEQARLRELRGVHGGRRRTQGARARDLLGRVRRAAGAVARTASSWRGRRAAAAAARARSSWPSGTTNARAPPWRRPRPEDAMTTPRLARLGAAVALRLWLADRGASALAQTRGRAAARATTCGRSASDALRGTRSRDDRRAEGGRLHRRRSWRASAPSRCRAAQPVRAVRLHRRQPDGGSRVRVDRHAGAPRAFDGARDVLALSFSDDGDVSGEVVFAGYGIVVPESRRASATTATPGWTSPARSCWSCATSPRTRTRPRAPSWPATRTSGTRRWRRGSAAPAGCSSSPARPRPTPASRSR